MQCANPIRIWKNLDRQKYPDGLEVPCGKCLMCRIQKRKEWAMRCLHELDNWNSGVFITLTYNPENLPKNSSVKRSELQKFFKRLRQAVYPRVIRYFACGEYGEEKERPHYHAIIYGMSLKEDDKDAIKKCWKLCDWSKVEDGCFGLAEPDSIRYVAQYIDKKLMGEDADKEYKDKGREPPFKIQSMGIGKCYVENNLQQLIDNQSITMFGVEQTLPRYYLNKSGIDPELRRIKSEEKEKDLVKKLTGVRCTDDEYYKGSSSETYWKYYNKLKAARKQRERTALAKCNLKNKKI